MINDDWRRENAHGQNYASFHSIYTQRTYAHLLSYQVPRISMGLYIWLHSDMDSFYVGFPGLRRLHVLVIVVQVILLKSGQWP